MKNNPYNTFNLISKAVVPNSFDDLCSAEHGLIEDIVGYGMKEYNYNWKTINYSESLFHKIPLIGQARDEDVLVLALHDEEDQSKFTSVLISNNTYPTFVEFVDFMPEEGYDLKTYNLLEAYTFYEIQTRLAVSSLGACYKLIGASTKLTKSTKKKYLKHLHSDIQFIEKVKQQAYELREKIGRKAADDQFEIQIAVIGLQLHTNGMHYWQLLKDHKVTDFNFITEK